MHKEPHHDTNSTTHTTAHTHTNHTHTHYTHHAYPHHAHAQHAYTIAHVHAHNDATNDGACVLCGVVVCM